MSIVRMRDDLADDEVLIPAYDDVEEPDTGVGLTFLSAQDLQGAQLIGDNDDDTKPHYWFEHIVLTDRRQYYVHGVDLDYEWSDA